jgi:hypothetical protein
MTASATANRVTIWRALVGVEVMGGEYMTRGFGVPGAGFRVRFTGSVHGFGSPVLGSGFLDTGAIEDSRTNCMQKGPGTRATAAKLR